MEWKVLAVLREWRQRLVPAKDSGCGIKAVKSHYPEFSWYLQLQTNGSSHLSKSCIQIVHLDSKCQITLAYSSEDISNLALLLLVRCVREWPSLWSSARDADRVSARGSGRQRRRGRRGNSFHAGALPPTSPAAPAGPAGRSASYISTH